MEWWERYEGLTFEVLNRKAGRPSQNKKVHYVKAIVTIDTETSRIKGTDNSILYLWQVAVALLDDTMHIKELKSYYGRYLTDFPIFMEKVLNGVPAGCTLCGYIHNLSYDIAFLSPVMPSLECFCLDRRKVLKCTAWEGKLEIRDSFRQTNRKLAMFAKDMKAEHGKLDGDIFDYNEERYPWTPLTEYQLHYAENDVLALAESITIEMEKFGDDIYTIPLTSTGYFRRDAKNAICGQAGMLAAIRDILPSKEVYEILRELFRGGNTHANRLYAGLIIDDVYSNDLSSSYPSWMIYNKYPITKFKKISHPSFRQITNIINAGWAVIMRVVMYDVELKKKDWGFPYLAKDKCRRIPLTGDEKNVYDNGRILKSEYLETSITDIDLKIILKEYTGRIEVIEAYRAKYGKLPNGYTSLIKSLYKDKTSLKGVDGDDEAFKYLLSKMKINAGYGMMAQNPCKYEVLYNNENGTYEYDVHEGVIDELLKKYHKKGWLPYQWGCYVTAWARYALECGLEISYKATKEKYGRDCTLYADTDSVKYHYDCYINFDEWNNDVRKKSEEFGGSAVDSKGKTHYMGVFEEDGYYKRFVTLGAKKYCYEDENGSLHITISGVQKEKGARELKRIENFSLADEFGFPFVFKDAGCVDAVYNDNSDYFIERDGKKLHVTRNICLRPSTYTLGATAEYTAFIDLNLKSRKEIISLLK